VNAGQWATLAMTLGLAFLSAVIGLVVYIVKGAARWARTEERLEELISDVKELVENKDQAHRLIMETIKDDREATNRRLRWLEEHLWRRDRNSGNAA